MKKLTLFLVALAMILTSCKPEIKKPTVVTKSVGEVTETTAKVVGQVTADGGAEVTERGVCWSMEQNPTIEDSHTTDGISTGTYTSNLTELNHGTTYYVRAYAINAKGITVYGEERTFKTLAAYSPATGTSNGYGYVDLGLSVKWATCNVGATSPEEYGDYFAWGETSTKETYTEDNCPTYGLGKSKLESQGYIDSEGNLTSQYDAATANCGGTWRMPTYAELDELNTQCTWEWINTNDFKGYKVTGPNGNSIFLPAAGLRDGSSLDYAGSHGYYWSSTSYYYYSIYGNDFSAYYLCFNSFDHYVNGYGSRRDYGRSVRSVLE